jgi:hypothetical protein
MKTNYDYVNEYLKAYQKLRNKAEKVIKAYGKELDVMEIGKQRLMEEYGYKDESEVDDEELQDWKVNNVNTCVFVGKHGYVYTPYILGVRYNKERNNIEAYLETDEGDVSEWLSVSYVSYEPDAVYMTILDFIKS